MEEVLFEGSLTVESWFNRIDFWGPYPACKSVVAKKIMVVDDDKEFHQIVKTKLDHDESLRIEYCDNAFGALRKLATYRPDLVLLDICMPGLDGIALATIIRKLEHVKHIPILAITQSKEENVLKNVYNSGIEDIEFKPLNIERMKKKIDRMIY